MVHLWWKKFLAQNRHITTTFAIFSSSYTGLPETISALVNFLYQSTKIIIMLIICQLIVVIFMNY